MKYKIYKILFVFAILFANIAPAPAAMTLDEYWKNSDMWNDWIEDIKVGNNKVNELWNIDCSDSNYSNNKCCTFITDPTGNDLKKLAVFADYTNETTREAAINGTATPIKCTYIPNDCFACNFTINDNKITAKCINSSRQDIYGADFITCPTPPNDTGFYAECEFDYYDDKEINGLGLEIHNYLNNCEASCPSLMTYNENNNICQCPDNADCSNIDEIKCRAGYYDSTPIGDILTCTYCPAGSYCPGDVGPDSIKPCPAGSYCPAGASAPTTCPIAWPNSNAESTQIENCYADLGDNTGNMLKYIYCPNGTNSPSTCEQQETNNIIDDQGSSFRGNKYPGGKQNYPNTGKIECTYDASTADTPENVNEWLKTACPLKTSPSIRTEASYKIGKICYAEVIIGTTCGKILKEAVPMGENGIYLTWNDTQNQEVNGHYYRTLNKGLYATDLISENYCSAGSTKKRLYRTAKICPAGKYCEGFPDSAPDCPNDGTNPNEFPPNGDVAGGYYSTGGAYSSTPNKSGDGCLSGYNCGKCPAGSISPAGAASCSTCPDGEYSDTDGASTCKSCTNGYFCVNGLRNKCPAGSTSDAGESAKTGCYIKGGDGGTGFCVNNECFNIQKGVQAYFTPISSN